jgi:hypothetical protein
LIPHIENIFIHIAVKIEQPDNLNAYTSTAQEKFAFDKNNCFTDYYPKTTSNSFLTLDDKGQWYFFTHFNVHSFSELKLARQIYKPPYLKDEARLPLIEQLTKEQLIPKTEGYDKGFAHVSVKVKDLESLSPIIKSKLANADGEDDPIVSSNLHYIRNTYNGAKTHFISGIETNSFATITENEHYYNNIHIPKVSNLYLKYYVYFIEHGIVPSTQMMPRLLNNLWLSTQANTNNWNGSLFKRISLPD